MFSNEILNKMSKLKALSGLKSAEGEYNLVARVKSAPKGQFLYARNSIREIKLGAKGRDGDKVYTIRESAENTQGGFRLWCSCRHAYFNGFGKCCKHIQKLLIQYTWMYKFGFMFTNDLIIYSPESVARALLAMKEPLYPKVPIPKVNKALHEKTINECFDEEDAQEEQWRDAPFNTAYNDAGNPNWEDTSVKYVKNSAQERWAKLEREFHEVDGSYDDDAYLLATARDWGDL